jgi:hypothetical protein
MHGTSDQAKLNAAGIPFTTRNIQENRFWGTAVVIHTRYMAQKALKVLGVDPIHLHKNGTAWEIKYF